MKVRVLVCSMLIVESTFVDAAPLHNWRMPFYQVASEMEMIGAAPSGMFWDDLGTSPLFDMAPSGEEPATALQPNRWTMEPAYGAGFQSTMASKGMPVVWECALLNDIYYRNVMVRQTLQAERGYDRDSLFPAHPDRFARGRIEEAYLQVDWRWGFLRFGRMLRNWGPFPDHSLLLSSNPFSYDALEWQLHSSLFEFRQLFTGFFPNGHRIFLNTDDNKAGRFLSVHALNLLFGEWVTLGIIESMVFRRDNGFPDLQYVNPFSIYTVSNTNQEGGGNLMLGFQWNVHPGVRNLRLCGQIAFDDFQVDSKEITDKEPPHWGIDAAIYWRDGLPLELHHLVKAGYRRCSEWIYTVPDNNMANGEGYTYLSKGLGAAKNDGDSTWCGISVIGEKAWVATAGVSYARAGDKSVTSRWHDTDTLNIGGLPFDYKEKKFPSGIVESSFSVRVEGAAYYKNYCDIRLGIENRFVRNRDHRTSAEVVYSPVITAMLNVHFATISLTLPQ